MEKLKLIIFIEFIGMFVVASFHLLALFTKEKFPLELYLIVSGIVLVCCTLVAYVFIPIADWFL